MSSRNGTGPQRLLITGGRVVTLDSTLGDDIRADVLVENGTIAAVARDISAADAVVVDATGCIVAPGFVDTHRHLWEGLLRNMFPDLSLTDYYTYVLHGIAPSYRPEDAYVGNLLSALGAIDAGITTILDFSHIQNTPEHTDACIAALYDSGIRAVFGYGFPCNGNPRWWEDPGRSAYPGDLRRIRTQCFSSADQLLTLALAPLGPGSCPDDVTHAQWNVAREVGARISVHAGAGTKRGLYEPFATVPGFFGSDTTYIHCNAFSDAEWKLVAASGGTVSLSPSAELPMGHGLPATQRAIDHGIRPSLSVDVETTNPGDFFTTLRLTLYVQRHEVNAKRLAGQTELPAWLTARDVLEFGTIEGARACGLDTKIGSLTPGKDADIVILRGDRVNVMPINNAIGAIVEGMDTSNVDTVIVRGNIRKRHGELVDVDLAHVRDRVAASRDYVVRAADTRTPGLLALVSQ